MPATYRNLRVTVVFLLLGVASQLPLSAQQAVSPVPFMNAHGAQSIHLKPFFERNDGQLSDSVLYQVHGLEYSALLTRDGATLLLCADSSQPNDAASDRCTIHLSFIGINPRTDVTGLEKLDSYSNYFSGSDPAKWHTKVPQYFRVQYRNIYPGIDLVFYIRDSRLEYDFILAPGADPKIIKMNVDGSRVRIDRNGDVLFGEGHGRLMTLRKPRAHSMASGGDDVTVSYIVHQNGIRLKVGDYDHTNTLVIDPALKFATFVTGGFDGCDIIRDIAADVTGVYVSGLTCASSFPFDPLKPAPTKSAALRAFVTKLDPSSGQAIFTSFISESGAPAIAIDSSGAVYLAGEVTNPDASFPVTTGAYSTAVCQHFPFEFQDSCRLPYAAKLSPDGATLLYSTFLQRASGDPAATPFPHTQQLIQIEKIALDDQGALYITGESVGQSGSIVLNL
jgi:hypothetical protein